MRYHHAGRGVQAAQYGWTLKRALRKIGLKQGLDKSLLTDVQGG
jgi:hypothetical protein